MDSITYKFNSSFDSNGSKLPEGTTRELLIEIDAEYESGCPGDRTTPPCGPFWHIQEFRAINFDESELDRVLEEIRSNTFFKDDTIFEEAFFEHDFCDGPGADDEDRFEDRECDRDYDPY